MLGPRLPEAARPAVDLSVVLPYFNEAQNLQPLLERLRATLDGLAGASWEAIFVDDASSDGSAETLDAHARADPRLKVVHFARNFGHQAALSAGLDFASGRAVVLMDADLQDPPEVLPSMVQRWREGFDVVYAIRRKRKENLAKRAAYSLFYRSMRLLADIELPLDAGDFCLMDARVVRVLVAMPERHRFLRGLRSWVGFRQTGVEYERAARLAGEPKYTARKLARLALSGYVGFSVSPLRMAIWLGMVAAATGLAVSVWALVAKLTGVPVPWGWTSTMTAIMFLGGVQLFVTGIVGEYLGRVYDEVRGRPVYVIQTTVGFDSPDRPGDAERVR
jgi:dolichol-phosphate mannosyltransferase